MTRDTCFQHIGVREHGCVSYSSLGGLNDLSSLKSFIFYILIILFNFLLIVVTLFPSVSVFLIPLILLRQIASFVFFIAFLLAVTIHIYFLFLMFSYSCKLPCPCQCNFLFISFFFSFLKSFYSLWVRKKEASIGLFDVQWWNITLKYEDSSLMYMLTLYSVTLKNLWGSRKQWIYAAFILYWILWISSYIIGSCDWIISMATLCHREFVGLWLVRLRRL